MATAASRMDVDAELEDDGDKGIVEKHVQENNKAAEDMAVDEDVNTASIHEELLCSQSPDEEDRHTSPAPNHSPPAMPAHTLSTIPMQSIVLSGSLDETLYPVDTSKAMHECEEINIIARSPDWFSAMYRTFEVENLGNSFAGLLCSFAWLEDQLLFKGPRIGLPAPERPMILSKWIS